MDPKPTLQTLQLDCLLEVLKYVPLPECMILRSVCRQLKAAVDEHFRSGVRELPVLLKVQSNLKVQYDQFLQFNHRGRSPFASLLNPFESKQVFYTSASGWEIWKDVAVRPKNYFSLLDLNKFIPFLYFITKYLPGITKLSFLIDNEDYFNMIPEVLKLYRKQLKVLQLETTTEFSESLKQKYLSDYHPKRCFFSEKLNYSIDSLEGLEKLSFFVKSVDTQSPFHKDLIRTTYLAPDNGRANLSLTHFWFLNRENLKELACKQRNTFRWTTTKFSRLEKLTISKVFDSYKRFLKADLLSNLKQLNLDCWLQITDKTLIHLNSFTNLRHIQFKAIHETEGVAVVNKSIKIIEVATLYLPSTTPNWFLKATDQAEIQDSLQELIKSLRLFTGLEKLIVREPFIELTGSELRNVPNFLIL